MDNLWIIRLQSLLGDPDRRHMWLLTLLITLQNDHLVNIQYTLPIKSLCTPPHRLFSFSLFNNNDNNKNVHINNINNTINNNNEDINTVK